MAKKGMHECKPWFGWLILIIGILYLLSDLGVFTWWGATIKWWTVVFVLFGLNKLMK